MESLLHDILGWLVTIGPTVVFLVVMVETAAFVGLLVPAEATVLLAAFLAWRGVFGLDQVFWATFLGALAGDQTGYLLGRFGGTRLVAREGRLGRLWRRHEPAAARLFQRHAATSVTLARFVSFVRTLMPWFAGMSRMPYPRFLAFDLLGVLGWAAGSVALGYLAGESWRIAAGAVGTASTILVGGLAVGATAVVLYRRRRGAAAPAAPATPPATPVAAAPAASAAAGAEEPSGARLRLDS